MVRRPREPEVVARAGQHPGQPQLVGKRLSRNEGLLGHLRSLESTERGRCPPVRLVGNSASLIRFLKAKETLLYDSMVVRSGIYFIIIFR